MPTSTLRLPAALRSLRHRDFRLLWSGLIFSAVGTWMQIVAQSLLVLRLTRGSALALGLVSLAQAAAFFLFALIGGGVADRLDRRKLLFVTQTVLLCLALLLGFLTRYGAIEVWMVILIAFLSGATLSFDQPCRAALIASVVPRADLLNAISLQSAVFNGAATLGPALAGIAVERLGLDANFFLNAFSYLAVLLALTFVRAPANVSGGSQPRFFDLIQQALLTVRRDAVLPWLLVLLAVLLFCGPSLPLLLPVIALRNLHIGATSLGALFSAAGAGSILGAILLASFPPDRSKSALFFLALTLWSIALAVVGTSHWFGLTVMALVVFGLAQSVVAIFTATLLQSRVGNEQRGRVMSLNTLLIMGVRPLGDFPAGAAISLFGAPVTAVLSGLFVALAGLLLRWGRPALRSF